jgi:hypothetical protein
MNSHGRKCDVESHKRKKNDSKEKTEEKNMKKAQQTSRKASKCNELVVRYPDVD